MIAETLLIQFGARTITLEKNEVLFDEGSRADYYYQIVKGAVKMYNLTEEGKEFVQGIFEDGKSFGEPPLFGSFSYPAAAMATEKTQLMRLLKKDFLALLVGNPEVHLGFTRLLCNRLAYKAMIGKEVSVHPPEHRILTFLGYLKNQQDQQAFTVPITRQQIAELTGLRVETVIRAIKKLESEKKLRLENHKIIL